MKYNFRQMKIWTSCRCCSGIGRNGVKCNKKTNPLIPLVVSTNTIWHPTIPHFNCSIPAASEHGIYFIGELYTADFAFMFSEDCLCTCIQVIHLEGLVETTTVGMDCIL